MQKKDLEKKLKEVTSLLEKEQAEKKKLQQQVHAPPLISYETVARLFSRLRNKVPQLSEKGRRKAERDLSPVATKSALEESVTDDTATYRKKLASYSNEQLEDIFLHIDRDLHKDRFVCVVEELKKRI